MTPHNDPRPEHALLGALKQVLHSRGLTYAQVAGALGVSLPTVKRQLSRGGLSVERLLAICALAEIDLHELTRISRRGAAASPYLTLPQEQALAASEPLMLVFHLLLAGWSVAEIRTEYQFHAANMRTILAQLAAVQLLDLPRRGQPRLRVPPALAWRHDGPVMGRYGAAARGEFLSGDFTASDAWLALESRELTAASRQLLRRKLMQLQREFLQLAELDATLAPASERHNTGLVLALRPWVFSIARVRRRPAPGRREPGER